MKRVFRTGRQVTVAYKMYAVLRAVAILGETITYGELVKRINIPGVLPRSLGIPLDIIHDLCEQNKFPDLASIVVNAATKQPGEAYCKFDEHHAERAKVFAFDWSKIEYLAGAVQVKF